MEVENALYRATWDFKNPCNVLHAIRLDIVQNILCEMDKTNGLITTSYTANANDFINRQYEGLFDDFHYDIGHGKGTGEGSVNSEPVQDGYSGRPNKPGPVGDFERDTGAAVRTYDQAPNFRKGGY